MILGYFSCLCFVSESYSEEKTKGVLKTDMNIKNAEVWKEITDFYYKNSDNPASILESDLLVAQYNEIVEKQSFIQDKLSEYSLLYEEAKINFAKISPELLSLD